MSHYAVVKVKIQNPDARVLERALQRLAEKLNATVKTNAVVRGWNFRRRVNYLLETSLPYGNGYGVEINSKGEVVVHVDDHDAPMTAQEFQQELQKLYTAEAVKEALQELGYDVTEQEQRESIVIHAYALG